MSYSTRRDTDPRSGQPVIEILHDGHEWGETHQYKEHFRFGPVKARMIVTAKAVISEFLESEGQKPAIGQRVVATDDGHDPFSVTCCNYDHFPTHGHVIEQQYLKLRAGQSSLGFGLSKAEALIVLMNHIERFAGEHNA